MTLHNWSGNVAFNPARFHEPTSIAELQKAVIGAGRCRVLGTGHSFNTIADTPDDLISLRSLPARIDIDPDAREVAVSAGTRYGDLATRLHRAGWALHNLGSLPHISVGGAVATGTHGSGDANANLATQVRGVTLVGAPGDLIEVRHADRPTDFSHCVIALGSIGVVTALTLRIEPTYDVSQVVYEDVPYDLAFDHLDDIFAAGYSVSLFTTWSRAVVDQIWVKNRVDEPRVDPSETLDRSQRATAPRHPLPTLAGDTCTTQLGVVGPWHERLPHFRLDHMPSFGEELQSEYFVSRVDAVAALRSLAEIRSAISPVLLVSELRSVAADDFSLSPAFARDTMAIHFTWKPDAAALEPVLRMVEERLAVFGARPHWGKVFSFDPTYVCAQYPGLGDMRATVASFDPTAKFANDFVRPYLRP